MLRRWPLIAAAAALTGLAFGLVGGAQTSQAAPAQQDSFQCTWQAAGRAANDLFHAASAMDTDLNHLYIYGGLDESFDVQNTVERGDFSGPNPSATNVRVAAGGALQRYGAAGAYRAKGDTDESAVYFIGGIGGGDRGQAEGDVQRFATKAGSWSNTQLRVNERAFAAAVYVPAQDAIWVIGGVNQCPLADVLMGQGCRGSSIATQYITWDAMSGVATVNTLSGANLTNFGHTAVFDSANNRILVFGGTNNNTSGNNTLVAIDVSDADPAAATVANVTTSGAAPRLWFHGAAYDSDKNWMVVVGGVNQNFLQRSESTEARTLALDLTQSPPAWENLNTSLQDRVGGNMEYAANHNVALFTLGRNKFSDSGDPMAPDDQTAVRNTSALVCSEIVPTATPGPTDTPDPNVTPSATPEGPTPVPPTPTRDPNASICEIAANKVPGAVINAATGNPQSVAGYGLRCNPNLPAGPLNPERGWLSLRNPGLPYHPLFNGLVWKCGCP